MQSFFIRLIDYFSQKGQFMNFELPAFRYAFFSTRVVSESAFSVQEKHMLEHKLGTTTINITKNSAASKKHTLNELFSPRMLTVDDTNYSSSEDERDD